jgi:hypothetical protein
MARERRLAGEFRKSSCLISELQDRSLSFQDGLFWLTRCSSIIIIIIIIMVTSYALVDMFRPRLIAASKVLQVVFVYWSIIHHYFWYPVLVVVLLPLNSADKKSFLFCSDLCIKGMLADRNKLLCASRRIPFFTLARPFQLCCHDADEILRCQPHHLVPHQEHAQRIFQTSSQHGTARSPSRSGQLTYSNDGTMGGM